MTSIALRFKGNVHLSHDLISFKHWLALQSCVGYHDGMGFIYPSKQPTKIKYMFKKNIKLLCNYMQWNTLITEDGENYFWQNKRAQQNIEDYDDDKNNEPIFYFTHTLDLTNTRIKKCAVNYDNILVLTDDKKIYYYCNEMTLGMNQMVIERKVKHFTTITCFACGEDFYVLVIDNHRTYSWGKNFDDETTYNRQLCEVTELSGKTIGNSLQVKVVCGLKHALVLTDKGEVYAWGSNKYKQSNIANEYEVIPFPTMVDIPNVKKISDIAAVENMSIAKSSEDGLVYIWGCWAKVQMNKNVICEYTNIFDICNTMVGQSPVSMELYTDEDTNILNDLTDIFDDRWTSDLTIKIGDFCFHVHKAILKIRSSYFRKMFRADWIENKQRILVWHHYSYIVYEAFLRYLYTGVINQLSLKNLLDLLILADAYCDENLERDCIWMIRKQINATNVLFVNNVAVQYNKKELEEYCLKFFRKNMTRVMLHSSFINLDSNIRKTLITKINNMYPIIISE